MPGISTPLRLGGALGGVPADAVSDDEPVAFGVEIVGHNRSIHLNHLEAGSRFLKGDGESFEEPLFVYRAPDAKRLVSLTQVIGVDHLAVFGGLSDELKPAFHRLSKLLATYPFSVVSIQEQSLGDAVEIFQRINQGGKRLGRYDLVCANVWTVEFDFRKKVEEVNDSLADKGFGSIDNTIYTQTFALALHGKCTTTAELSVTTDEVQVAWKRVIKCVSRAVDFAATNLGVRRAEYLPYRGIVTVLAAYFYGSDRANPTEEERRTLWEWFWRVTLSERYGSTSPSRMAEDLRLLLKAREGEPVVFSYPSKVTPEVVLRTKMTSTAWIGDSECSHLHVGAAASAQSEERKPNRRNFLLRPDRGGMQSHLCSACQAPSWRCGVRAI